MLNSFGPDEEHSLLQQELSDSEVREILERLSAEEFAAPLHATVSAVCEATGASADVIGRILADIRKQNIEERYGEAIERHEEKIGELDERTHELANETGFIRSRTDSLIVSDRRSRGSLAQDSEVAAELDRIARENIAARKMTPYSIAFLIIALIVFAPFMCSSPQAGLPDTPTFTSSIDLQNGARITADDRGGLWVTEADGSKREPTAAEREEALPILIAVAQRNRRD